MPIVIDEMIGQVEAQPAERGVTPTEPADAGDGDSEQIEALERALRIRSERRARLLAD